MWPQISAHWQPNDLNEVPVGVHKHSGASASDTPLPDNACGLKGCCGISR